MCERQTLGPGGPRVFFFLLAIVGSGEENGKREGQTLTRTNKNKSKTNLNDNLGNAESDGPTRLHNHGLVDEHRH